MDLNLELSRGPGGELAHRIDHFLVVVDAKGRNARELGEAVSFEWVERIGDGTQLEKICKLRPSLS